MRLSVKDCFVAEDNGSGDCSHCGGFIRGDSLRVGGVLPQHGHRRSHVRLLQVLSSPAQKVQRLSSNEQSYQGSLKISVC